MKRASVCGWNLIFNLILDTINYLRQHVFFPVENGGSSWNFLELAIGERGQLEVKDEKENMPLVDRVAIVVETDGAVCQLYLRLSNSTLAT